MKRIFCVLFCIVTAISLVNIALAAEDGYMMFQPYGIYKTEAPLDAIPTTYEAWVRVPEGRSGTSGVVISNANSYYNNSFQIHIYEDGAPAIKFVNKVPDGPKFSYKSYTFSNSAVNTGEWTHVAIVADTSAEKISCYINGELSETKTFSFVPELSPLPLVLGGVNLSGNADFYKGQLRSVALYADARTEDEIKADMTKADVNDANLLAYYDLTDATFGDAKVADAAGKNDMLYIGYDEFWQDNVDAVTDFAYSFAIIGDQQKVVNDYPDDLHYMYDWILANKDTKKIEYVVALGDITDDYDEAAEFTLVKEQFNRLSGKIPYAVVRGNHDYSDPYNQYMSYDGYTSDVVGRYEEGKLDNHYKFAKIGNTDYLFLVLDFGMSDEVIEWASGVVEAHPNHKVIMVTHSYMHEDGTLTDAGDYPAPTSRSCENDGIDMWEKFVRKYENILMVLCGHIESDEILVRKSVGDHGNVVTQVLINPQGIDVRTPTGMVAMFYFNEEGNIITTDWYSTIQNQYYMPKVNRFTMYVGERSGDANGDGNITVADAITALGGIFGNNECKNADVDGDGKITLQDALGIMRMAVKGE